MSISDSAPALKLLGGAIITVGDTPLGGPAAHRHRLALLALLATTGRPMSRDKIVAYLWPERDTEGARNLLKTAVHELRKVVGEATILSIGDQLSVDSALLRCDVTEFEAAVASGDLDAAARLYAGPFLDGFFLKDAKEFEEWADGHRARLEAAAARVRDMLATRPSPLPVVDRVATTPEVKVRPVAPGRAPKHRTKLAVAAGIAALVVVGLIAWKRDRGVSAPVAAVILPDSVAGTALLFDGATSFVGTSVGTIVTPQSDNITIDLMLRWDGRTKDEIQTIFYNGHGGLSGWGLLVTGRENSQEDGTIAVLAGGITITGTTLVLKPGRWQHLVAERRDGKVTVTLDDLSYSIGAFPVNALGEQHRAEERTTVGTDGIRGSPQNVFRGAIDRLRIRDLASNYFVDRWNFDEGSGQVTVGDKGALLYVDNARWTPAPKASTVEAFWRRMELACGQAYSGTVAAATPDSIALRGPLVLHLRSCEPNTIRAALHVANDRSRTFVLARTPSGLQLTHEVHRADGTPGASAVYAAGDSATLDRQEFVSALRKADRWTIEIEPRDHLTYFWRGPQGQLRLEFDLKRTVVSPPPPWSIRPQ